MPHRRFWQRGATCHAISAAAGTASCRFLSSLSRRLCFLAGGLALFCTKPRVRTKQQSCRSTAFRVLCSKTMLTQKTEMWPIPNKKPCVFSKCTSTRTNTCRLRSISAIGCCVGEHTSVEGGAASWDSGGGEENSANLDVDSVSPCVSDVIARSASMRHTSSGVEQALCPLVAYTALQVSAMFERRVQENSTQAASSVSSVAAVTKSVLHINCKVMEEPRHSLRTRQGENATCVTHAGHTHPRLLLHAATLHIRKHTGPAADGPRCTRTKPARQ